jgi:hypothetical protein
MYNMFDSLSSQVRIAGGGGFKVVRNQALNMLGEKSLSTGRDYTGGQKKQVI